MLLARTQIKEILKEAGINNLAGDYLDRLEKKVEEIVKESAKRAKENQRRTVMGRDV
ncbi:MAG: DUF1931 domain-containing protein [archaeon]|nr:DUF1931 domain-containing protein [Nanoarchaeota archaeon]